MHKVNGEFFCIISDFAELLQRGWHTKLCIISFLKWIIQICSKFYCWVSKLALRKLLLYGLDSTEGCDLTVSLQAARNTLVLFYAGSRWPSHDLSSRGKSLLFKLRYLHKYIIFSYDFFCNLTLKVQIYRIWKEIATRKEGKYGVCELKMYFKSKTKTLKETLNFDTNCFWAPKYHSLSEAKFITLFKHVNNV